MYCDFGKSIQTISLGQNFNIYLNIVINCLGGTNINKENLLKIKQFENSFFKTLTKYLIEQKGISCISEPTYKDMITSILFSFMAPSCIINLSSNTKKIFLKK